MPTPKPRARRDLQISHQTEGGRSFVVIKDPRSRRYLKLREPEFWLFERMDGTRAPAELESLFAEQFEARLPEGTLGGFIDRLAGLNLLEGAGPSAYLPVTASQPSRLRDAGGLLSIKLKAVDPDRWLGTWARRLRFLFRPWFWPVTLLVIAGALVIVAANGAHFRFTLAGLLDGGSLAAIVASMFLVISLHEIAHGLTCRHLGGHVHEMGFLLLYFQPCLYCDLSDSWLFREKWKKLLVTFSGAYFQILLGALAVWGWRISAPGTLPHQAFKLLAIVSLFNVLFNFNPLIKLDGYYLLSDALGIPNLRARAFAWMAHRLLGRPWDHAEAPLPRERRIYWLYGTGALLYSALLIGYLLLLALQFAVGRWRAAGLLLYLLALAVIFRRPLARAGARGWPRALWNVRKTILWAAAGVALLLAALVPFTYRVGSPARIEPWAQVRIAVLPNGYLVTEWYDRGDAEQSHAQLSKLVASGFTTLGLSPPVAVGDSVAVGDTILRVAADEFATRYDEAAAALRAKQAELDLLRAPPKPQQVAEARARIHEESTLVNQSVQTYERTRTLFERKLVPRAELELAETALRAQQARLESTRQRLAVLVAPPKAEAVAQLEADLVGLERQLSFYAGQVEATVVTSAIAGRVVRLSGKDGEICRIARVDSLRCVMQVAEQDAPLVKPGQEVTLKIPSAPFATYRGRVVRISPMGESASEHSTFEAVASLANHGELAAGMTGYAKIATGKATVAWRATRKLVRFIRIEFWSWW